ncbi:MAG: hypothetical protein BEN19_01945 [Epulopiscium sp. Nuni2H_MBin003]|nr:MAG: hypothetical protein BEN19_01945 [Epulopiscium sp. Nuni2H_MBin003]
MRGNVQRRGSRRQRYEEPKGNGLLIICLLIAVVGGYYYFNPTSVDAWSVVPTGIKTGVNNATDFVKNLFSNSAEEISESYTMPFFEANAVKILATTLHSEEFVDIPQDNWYSKYYRVLKADTRFDFLTEENANVVMTHDKATQIINQILGDGYSLNTQVSLLEESIPFEQFLDIYQSSLETIGKSNVLQTKTLSVISTSADNLATWNVLTSDGIYDYHGFILEPLVDNTLEVVVSDNYILGINQITHHTGIIEGCYIVDVLGDTITIKTYDIEMQYKHSNFNEADKGSLVNLEIQDGTVISFTKYLDQLGDTVLRITNDYIEFAKSGKFFFDSVEIFGADNISKVATGTQVSYSLKDDKITSLSILKEPTMDNVRIVVSEDSLGGYTHKNIKLISQDETQFVYNDKIISLGPNDEFELDKFDFDVGEKIKFSENYTSGYTITSIVRQNINPTYVGSIEIYKEQDGYIIINEVDMDNYIARVIPSEMPTSFGLEACKVQAISARSYALVTGATSKFTQYGGNVDDTIASQVYNNVKIDDISLQAAKDTSGMVLKYDNKVISGNFYSTSAGYSANFGEVWAGSTFPTSTPIYLSSQAQYLDDFSMDMTTEEDAWDFFTLTPGEIDAFDSDAPWFRWEVTYNGDELSNIINNCIQTLTSIYPDTVRRLNVNKWESGVVDSIGTVQDIEVVERGEGGNIMSLLIVGSKEAILVDTEYLIRTILAPNKLSESYGKIGVTRADGSVINDLSLLPSAFFTYEKTYDKNGAISQLKIYGGGNGHGVGMSQEGVKGMVDLGYTYDEILKHYYVDIEIGYL